jgi:hypothetical protein
VTPSTNAETVPRRLRVIVARICGACAATLASRSATVSPRLAPDPSIMLEMPTTM